jgi:hypothetical protein
MLHRYEADIELEERGFGKVLEPAQHPAFTILVLILGKVLSTCSLLNVASTLEEFGFLHGAACRRANPVSKGRLPTLP